MAITIESEYKSPENLGCKYGDDGGKLCAAVSCWAQILRTNLADEGNTPERWERDKKIVEDARAKGCPNV